MSITLVAALGNPGRDYEKTRHNLAWVVIDAFAKKLGLTWKTSPQFEAEIARWDNPGRTCYFAKPLTFMNDSGRAVAALARFYKVPAESIVAVYDDLNIDLGLIKVSVTGSAGGHNGLKSIEANVKTQEYSRLRIGIAPDDPTRRGNLADYVLDDFGKREEAVVRELMPTFATALELWVKDGIVPVMNKYTGDAVA